MREPVAPSLAAERWGGGGRGGGVEGLVEWRQDRGSIGSFVGVMGSERGQF